MLHRQFERNYNQLRPVKITRNYTAYAEGAVLVEFGETKVICTASIDDNLPAFVKNTGSGWITAEYAMLPRATHKRSQRDNARAKPNARAQEIQRLIGRSLRAVVDLSKLGERQIILDCDVIQADGGTRTASITGAYVALHDAVTHLLNSKSITENPIKQAVAAVSVGMLQNIALLDLDYAEDSNCDTDLNVVMGADGGIIELQGTAEGTPFSRGQLYTMLDLAESGIRQLFMLQQAILIN